MRTPLGAAMALEHARAMDRLTAAGYTPADPEPPCPDCGALPGLPCYPFCARYIETPGDGDA